MMFSCYSHLARGINIDLSKDIGGMTMRNWKATVLITGIILELVSLAGFTYMISIIPELDIKAMTFLSVPFTGMLFGVFVIWISTRIKILGSHRCIGK